MQQLREWSISKRIQHDDFARKSRARTFCLLHQVPTAYERLRAERIVRAELETPLVRGMRLLPVFSPGRYLLCLCLCTS